MDSTSQKSRFTGKYSTTSSFRRGYQSTLKKQNEVKEIEDIDEAAELER